MSNIKQLKVNDSNIYPITHEDAVMDDNGIAISAKYATQQNVDAQIAELVDEIAYAQEILEYVGLSLGDLNQLQTTNKSTIVAALNEAFQYGNSVRQSLVDALIAKNVNVSTSNSIYQILVKLTEMEGGSDALSILPPWYTTDDSTLINTWIQGSNITSSRQGAAGGAIGANIYVCGGCASASVSTNTTFVNTTYCYNTKTDVWETKANMSNGNKYEHAAAVANGMLYAIAGFSARNTTDNKVFCYDPSTNSWTTVNNYPVSCHSLAATTVNNKIYVCGGATTTTSGYGGTTNTAINSHYCYDPSLNSWTELKTMTAAKYQHASVGYKNQVYVMGGYRTNTNYCYDIASNAWTNKTVVPSSTADHSLSLIEDKIVLVGGGTGNSTTTASQTFRVYNPATDQWSTKANVPQAIINHVGVTVKNNFYAIGGKSSSSVRNTVYCYIPD